MCLFHRPVIIFQGDSAEGQPGPPGKNGEPGDRVGQTHRCLKSMAHSTV